MTCVKCKGQMSGCQLLNMTGRFKKETLTVQIEGHECAKCGHQIIAGRRMAEFMEKLADAYRVERGLLTSAQIRQQRERLGMSQTEFAAYVGVGTAGLKRWELGDIQTKAVDELIRLKTDPEYLQRLIDGLYRKLVTSKETRVEADPNRVRAGAATCELLAA